MGLRYDQTPIVARPPIRWPGGKRVAIILTMNIEVYGNNREVIAQYSGIPNPPNPAAPPTTGMAILEYGVRVGFWRILRLLDSFGVKVSAHVNADVVDQHPEIIAAIKQRRWEIVAHSTNQAEPPAVYFGRVDEERALIARTLDTLEQAFGSRPIGWVSPAAANTPETFRLLGEAGIEWFGDIGNDDQPYWVDADGHRMICIPYSFDVNDIITFNREMGSADDFVQKVRDEFTVLDDEGHESGRIMTIGVHPYLLGRPQRFVALERSLAYLVAQEGAWFCHRADILAALRQQEWGVPR
ncbi:MAG: polysaccharide deacetylase family protein [Dehalococcoidia bacterium]|nr:polysaccharide deacetylase family protein [Dehalococcoidia bacterium]